MERIRELQNLLGLNLDEIAIVLRNEDRMAQIRRSYHDERTSEAERRRLTQECITLQESLRATVDAKLAALAASAPTSTPASGAPGICWRASELPQRDSMRSGLGVVDCRCEPPNQAGR